MGGEMLTPTQPLSSDPQPPRRNRIVRFFARIGRISAAWIPFLLGIILLILSIVVDSVGIGLSGVGIVQASVFLSAVVLLGIAFLPPVRRTHIGKGLLLFLLLLIIVGSVLGGLEVYYRSAGNYRLDTLALTRGNFLTYAYLKTWNRQYFEATPELFNNWPVELQLFDAPTQYPTWLYLPNQSYNIVNGLFVPTQPGETPCITTNSLGFRGMGELAFEKPEGVIRIVVLGASQTEGSQCSNETYPYYLEQELNRRYPDQQFEVINAGHHGYRVQDILELLRLNILPLDPDIILLYHAANDIDMAAYLDGVDCSIGTCWLESTYAPWHLWLNKYSALFGQIHYYTRWYQMAAPTPHIFNSARTDQQWIDYYEEYMRQIVVLAQENNVEIVPASFTTIAHEGLEVTAAENWGLYHNLYHTLSPLTPGEVAQIYDDYNMRSRRIADDLNVPYFDLAAIYPDEQQYFEIDSIHFSIAGNQLLAQLWADYLEREILTPYIDG